jgi:3-mercaptopyruvate sulfurtransferase SseA
MSMECMVILNKKDFEALLEKYGVSSQSNIVISYRANSLEELGFAMRLY